MGCLLRHGPSHPTEGSRRSAFAPHIVRIVCAIFAAILCIILALHYVVALALRRCLKVFMLFLLLQQLPLLLPRCHAMVVRADRG